MRSWQSLNALFRQWPGPCSGPSCRLSLDFDCPSPELVSKGRELGCRGDPGREGLGSAANLLWLCSRDSPVAGRAAPGSLGWWPPATAHPWAIVPALGHSLQEEGPGHGVATGVGAMEERVEVGQQRVAQAQSLPHGLLRRLAEPVRLLRLRWAEGGGPGYALGRLLAAGQGQVPGRSRSPTRLCRSLWFRMKG